MSKQNISQYDKQDIQNVGVVSLAIRPNQPSQYGVGSLSGKQLQERFDLLATSAIDKLNKVIDILNGSEITEYLSLGSNYAYGEQKSVKDFIEDVYSATDGLITDDPATFGSKKAISNLVREFYDAINALEAFTEIADYDAEKKLSDVYAKITALNEHNTDEDAHEDIREDLNNLEASLDTKVNKIENATSAVRRVYYEKERGGGTDLLAAKCGYEGTETEDSIPIRYGSNTNHPGTFEVTHPVMDSTKSGYSEKHPVTVKVLKEYVAENGSGGDGCSCAPATQESAGLMSAEDKKKLDGIEEGATAGGGTGFVTKEEFEAFKEELTYEPIDILSFTVSGDRTYEIGSTVTSIKLMWYINKTPTELRLDGALVTGESTTVTGSWTSYKTWNLVASDGKTSDGASTSISFCNNVYYGASSSTSITSRPSGFVSELRSSALSSFEVDASSGEYIYYCHPTSYGTCGFIDKTTEFPYAFEEPKTVSFTNASGYTENYYVYRSTYAIPGTAKIKVT